MCPVDKVGFSVADGEIMGLAGESGCGKSTLGNSLIFLEGRMRHLGGRVELDGQELPIADFRAMRPYRMTKVSLVPQYAMSALNPTRRISKLTTDLLRSHGVHDSSVMAEMKRRTRPRRARVPTCSTGTPSSCPAACASGSRSSSPPC